MARGQLILLASLVGILCVHGHSWVACSDYRGDVNFFEQEKCVAWPRQYEPTPQAHGYQIADDESRAWGNGGCDRPMSSPDWRGAYTEEFPYAIYEPGKVYCLAWPMKNHATVFPSCKNPHAKSDPGLNEELALYISDLDPTQDPPQAVFNLRNVNELAGLADNCSHVWTNPDREMEDKCQLGLEKHRNNEIDCKGFQRSPKFCEDTGRAMGTGCFQVPRNMHPGHYVAQWKWDATFPGRGSFGYTTCFDFMVVPEGSPDARPGTPGTVGTAANSPPCENNMNKFSKLTPAPTPAGTPTYAPTSAPVTTPAPTPGDDCVQPYLTCDGPGMKRKCCTLGYECDNVNVDWAQCLPAPPTAAPTPAGPVSPTPAPTPGDDCVQPFGTCEGPDKKRTCCTLGYECDKVNADWGQCLPAPPTFAPTSLPEPTPEPTVVPLCATPYQICKGPDWHGPTCCTSGHGCVAQNAHWSQCLPFGVATGSGPPERRRLRSTASAMQAFV